jgi:hypothetical protein
VVEGIKEKQQKGGEEEGEINKEKKKQKTVRHL